MGSNHSGVGFDSSSYPLGRGSRNRSDDRINQVRSYGDSRVNRIGDKEMIDQQGIQLCIPESFVFGSEEEVLSKKERKKKNERKKGPRSNLAPSTIHLPLVAITRARKSKSWIEHLDTNHPFRDANTRETP